MKIIYMKQSVIECCEIQYNIIRRNEPDNVELVVREDETHIYTRCSAYKKEDLK
jgi:hypothetical protein